MKLFDDFEAVRMPEENLIFVTDSSYLYYIYDVRRNVWRKHKSAGSDIITVSNYPDVSKEEIVDAMGGVFPGKETDFLRLCPLSTLRADELLNLIDDDYSPYMSNDEIYYSVYAFLLESGIQYKAYLELRKLFNDAIELHSDDDSVLLKIKELSYAFIGKDIFKKEIRIVDGHDNSSYFWIRPVRVIDYSNTDDPDNVSIMRTAEISIEEDVAQYLAPFLIKHFDNGLEANKRRMSDFWIDDEGDEQFSPIEGFEWYLTHNFYSLDCMKRILTDIRDTVEVLAAGRENEYTSDEEKIKEYNDNSPKEDDMETELIIDFFNRFIYRMEYMMTVGKENGYDLISFMGP